MFFSVRPVSARPLPSLVEHAPVQLAHISFGEKIPAADASRHRAPTRALPECSAAPTRSVLPWWQGWESGRPALPPRACFRPLSWPFGAIACRAVLQGGGSPSPPLRRFFPQPDLQAPSSAPRQVRASWPERERGLRSEPASCQPRHQRINQVGIERPRDRTQALQRDVPFGLGLFELQRQLTAGAENPPVCRELPVPHGPSIQPFCGRGADWAARKLSRLRSSVSTEDFRLAAHRVPNHM